MTEAQRCNEIVCRTNSLITMLTFFNNQIIQDSKKIPETLEKIQVEITSDGDSRPSEIISDLRTVAEALFYPMQMCGFLDESDSMHLCPQMERRQPCPHVLNDKTINQESYRKTLERERKASLRVHYSHANISLYLT